MSETATTGGTIVVSGWYTPRPPDPPPPVKRKPTRCLGRVGRRRCKCMANDLWCHRHKAQEEAYFLRLSKPWTKAQVLEWLAESAIGGWELEDSSFDPDTNTLTVKDWAGATFVLTITKHIRARPFKERLALKLSGHRP